MDGESMNVEGVNLAGFSIEGKILFPMKKTARQIEMAKVASKDRSSLIEAAKNGDEDAICLLYTSCWHSAINILNLF